jgi:hypothetical protein
MPTNKLAFLNSWTIKLDLLPGYASFKKDFNPFIKTIEGSGIDPLIINLSCAAGMVPVANAAKVQREQKKRLRKTPRKQQAIKSQTTTFCQK